MEITLEKIELVKDRTGVSYKEAKEALEKVDGNVVDAIIEIEEDINESVKMKLNERGVSIIEKIKELIKKGNVSKIVIKKEEEIILNIPVNVGIIGGVFAAIPTVVAIIAAFGTKCDIEIVKDSGAIIDVSEMANEKFGDMVEKGSEIADEVKVKGTGAYNSIKNKTNDVISKVKKNKDDSGCCCEEECYEEDDCYEDCSCGNNDNIEIESDVEEKEE